MNIKITLTWRLFTIVCFFVFATNVFSKTGIANIKGVVLDAKTGQALPWANIIVVGTERGAAADKNGEFVISQIPYGNYTLKARMMGYDASERQIQVSGDEGVFVKFELRENFFMTEQIVVTGTRTPKLMENSPVVTELVTETEIEETGAENVADVLQDRAGITVEQGSSSGSILRMNGVDQKRILVLVDGIPIAGKFNNRTQLDLIDADKIERIEIVKGPGSALYGSEAMAGVINVITKGISEDLKMDAKGKMGSHELYSGNISFSGKKRGLGYRISVDHSRGGIDKTHEAIDIKDQQNSSLFAKVSLDRGAIGRLELDAEYKNDEQQSESASMMGGMYNNTTDVERFNTHLNWKRTFKEKFRFDITAYISDYFRTYKSQLLNSTRPVSIDTTDETIIGIRSDFTYDAYKNATIGFGFDHSQDEFQGARVIGQIERKQTGIFGQLETTPVKSLTLIVGSRFDKITDIDWHTSPRLSALYTFSDVKIRAAWGGGFRAPTFLDMYLDYENPFIKVMGNPDLKPETSNGMSFGLEYFWGNRVLLNTTIYQNKFNDMIVDYSIGRRLLSYQNIEDATFTGLEWQSRFYILSNFEATVSYNYTDVDQSDEEIAISRTSPHSGLLRLNYSLFKNKLKLTIRDQFFSSRKVRIFDETVGRYSSDFENQEAYQLIDLSAAYKFNKLFSLRIGVTNLNDYTDDFYGPYIGRRFFTTLDIHY